MVLHVTAEQQKVRSQRVSMSGVLFAFLAANWACVPLPSALLRGTNAHLLHHFPVLVTKRWTGMCMGQELNNCVK